MLTQIELIRKYQLKIRGHLGQHLLIDPNISRKIIDLLDLQEGELLLEIGPGLGALSWLILEKPIKFFAVEKDAKFFEILSQEWKERKESFPAQYLAEAKWFQEDILEFDFDTFLSALPAKKKIKIVSNLPYYITAPILFQLMEHRQRFSLGVFMMQREVAKRLNALPGTRDYGRLSLATQYAAKCRYAMDVSPGCFTPQPEVDSSVVVMDFMKMTPLSPKKEKALFDLVRLAFQQRRKTLASLMVAHPGVGSKAKAAELLRQVGLPEGVRGEKLSLKDFLNLTEIVG